MKEQGFISCKKNHSRLEEKAYNRGYDACYKMHERRKEDES